MENQANWEQQSFKEKQTIRKKEQKARKKFEAKFQDKNSLANIKISEKKKDIMKTKNEN